MEDFYRKSKGNAGLDGVQFQVGLMTVFLLNALRDLKDWRMSTENEKAGKFDDVVIELSEGSAVLLQAKYKDNRRINKDQLLSANSKNADFSLLKYFFSYQEIKSKFEVKNIIICTNTEIDKKGLEDILAIQQASPDSLLHLGGEDCSFFTFKENILSDLRVNSEKYYDSNLRGKGINKDEISDRNLKDFFKKLQFFINYPSADKLEKIINDKLLPSLSGSQLRHGSSYKDIYGKIEDWFKQKCGEYLTESRANAMFCEIKSDQFCKTLKRYDVSFISTNLDIEEEKSIFHVNVERGYLLQALKTFHALEEQETLFVNPDDGVEVYKQAIEAFMLHKYKWLILIFHKNINYGLICEKIFKLTDFLKTCSYKKILLIDYKQHLQQSVLKDVVFEIDGSVKFSNLAEKCREMLVRQENINYQGRRTTLRELLGPSLVEDYDRALDSEGLEKLVRGEEITVGTSLGSLDPNIVRYYINRTIEREMVKMENRIQSGTQKEKFTEKGIFEVKEKFIIISDCAGMGKSTILAKLGENVKERYPHLWIIRIELNEYSRILRDSRRRKKHIGMTELLDSNEATRINNSLERIVFSMNKKVVVMLDGFDEISPNYEELVLSLLSQCQEGDNFAKVFVTTRPHLNRELENLLSVKPFLLQPFTTNDQIAFLANYWTHHLGLNDGNRDKCEKYAVALINKMSSWLKKHDTFAANPLQVTMLAEIFQEKRKEKDTVEWEGCKEFLVGAKQEPELPELMNICKLYERFIEIKWNIYLDKVNPTGTSSDNDSHEFQSDKCFINHQSLALQEILFNEAIHDKGIRHLFSHLQYDKGMETRMLKIGIVQMTNGKLGFVHRTFSEYFVAKSILEISELERGEFNQDLDFQQLFIDEILCNPQFTVIRAFLESALKDVVDSLPANILEIYRSLATSDPKSLKQRSELLHLLAREGHVLILELIMKSIQFKGNVFQISTGDGSNTLKILQGLVEKYGIDIENELGDTPLHKASGGGHLDMLRYLMRQRANIEKKNHKGESVIHLAAWNDHLEAMKFLTECGADITAVNNYGSTALHWAVQKSYLSVSKFLIEGGVDVNVRNKNGDTALYWASYEGDLDIVKWLVQCGHADVNVANNEGFTALHCAAEEGHLDICKFLVERGADVNIRSKKGDSALYWASFKGHLDFVKWLAESGHADVNVANNDGFTALHSAAEEGHLDICKFLVERGADVNICSKNGDSALYWASSKGHLDFVKWLAESGHADVNVANNDGFTALHCAAEADHLDICKFLVERGADVNVHSKNGDSALYWASFKGHLDFVKWLTESGHADVNVANNDRFMALHCAAEEGHLDICKFLVERGADVNVRSKNGDSALHLASFKGHFDVVKWLVECGHADVNVACNDDSTTLHCAVKKGHLEVCKFLVERGADVNMRNKNGDSALYWASLNGHLDVVKWLVECGHADINVANNDGFTALHCAAQKGHLEVCKFLVEGDVDVKVHNKNGDSALYSASLKGHLDVVKWLVECGYADVNVANNDGFTALHIAAQEGHLDVCKFLVEGGIDVNVCNKNGDSALQLASFKGHLDIVKWLTECGHADVNIANNYGFMALHIAAQEGHLDVCKFLVEGGVDVNVHNKNGDSALHLAAFKGHLDVVKWLVECGYADVNIANNGSFTALHSAAQEGHLDVCKFLVEGGVDVNVCNKYGESALYFASFKGHLEIVKWLVGCGHADINVANNDDSTALHCAAQEGYLDVCKFLVEGGIDVNVHNKNNSSVLYLASLKGHLHIVKWLTECEHADVNVANNGGFKALHIAAQEGHLDVCKFLVEGGVDVNVHNKNGESALYFASLKGHLDVVKWLVECGYADVNIANNGGFTALHYAAYEGHLDVCKFLVKRGVDPKLHNKYGSTALLLAAQYGHQDVVKWLVGCGHADVNKADNEGNTALQCAAFGGHLNVCRFLVEQGFDPKLHNKHGSTALLLAAEYGHQDIVKWLVECGHADINIANNDNSTALHCAAKKGHLEVSKFLVEGDVDVNVCDKDGSTALYLAIVEGHMDVTKILVAAGADVNIRNSDGLTALQTANKRGHQHIVEFLTETGRRNINAGHNT